MQKMSRKLDPQSQIARLEQRHGVLEQQIAALDAQRYLTAAEEFVLHDLKKQKLATKDQIMSLHSMYRGQRGPQLDAQLDAE